MVKGNAERRKQLSQIRRDEEQADRGLFHFQEQSAARKSPRVGAAPCALRRHTTTDHAAATRHCDSLPTASHPCRVVRLVWPTPVYLPCRHLAPVGGG